MTELEHARQCLQSGDYTCVLCKGKTVHTSTERGVKPLLRWIASGEDFSGFSAADKVVGKGAAFLYVRLGVKVVYATVISKSAWQVLQTHEIPVECGQIVENIINRKGDGICPFEAAVLEIEDAQVAYGAICRKMDEMTTSRS